MDLSCRIRFGVDKNILVRLVFVVVSRVAFGINSIVGDVIPPSNDLFKINYLMNISMNLSPNMYLNCYIVTRVHFVGGFYQQWRVH